MQPVPDEAGVSEDRLHPVVRRMTRVTIDRRNMGKSCYLRTHGSRNPLLGRGGVDATLREGREASLLERTGWCWSRNSGQQLLDRAPILELIQRAVIDRAYRRPTAINVATSVATRLTFNAFPTSASEPAGASLGSPSHNSVTRPPSLQIGPI